MNDYIVCDSDGHWEYVQAHNANEAIQFSKSEFPIKHVFLVFRQEDV